MKNKLIILSIFFLFSTSWSRTAAFEDTTAETHISRVLKLAFLLQYDEAFEQLDTLELLLPDHTLVALLRAGVYYCRTLDHEDDLDMPDFQREYDKAWNSAEELEASGEIAEADLYLGILLGFKALLYQRQDRWWPAVRAGLKSVKHLKACLAADSTYTDALLGVGTYKYWSSRATDFINWLPLIPDQKEQGIAIMHRAMNEGFFGVEISRSTLAWTLIDAGRYNEAIELSLEGLMNCPGSRFYLWTLAAGYYKMGKYRKASEVYRQLYDSIHSLERNNYYNEVSICKRLGQIYLGLNKPEEALVWIERGLSLPLDDEVRKRKKKTLEALESLQDKAEKRLRKKSG